MKHWTLYVADMLFWALLIAHLLNIFALSWLSWPRCSWLSFRSEQVSRELQVQQQYHWTVSKEKSWKWLIRGWANNWCWKTMKLALLHGHGKPWTQDVGEIIWCFLTAVSRWTDCFEPPSASNECPALIHFDPVRSAVFSFQEYNCWVPPQAWELILCKHFLTRS